MPVWRQVFREGWSLVTVSGIRFVMITVRREEKGWVCSCDQLLIVKQLLKSMDAESARAEALIVCGAELHRLIEAFASLGVT